MLQHSVMGLFWRKIYPGTREFQHPFFDPTLLSCKKKNLFQSLCVETLDNCSIEDFHTYFGNKIKLFSHSFLMQITWDMDNHLPLHVPLSACKAYPSAHSLHSVVRAPSTVISRQSEQWLAHSATSELII